jgi:plastocyanin domain-containing protein
MRRGVAPVCAVLWLVWVVWSAAPGLADGEATADLSPDGIQRATIIVDSYSYRPDHLIVKSGVPLELTLKSVTWLVPHNFLIDAPKAGLKVSEEVPAGKSITILFTPGREGHYKFFCDKKLLFFHSHEEKGMAGTLEVR